MLWLPWCLRFFQQRESVWGNRCAKDMMCITGHDMHVIYIDTTESAFLCCFCHGLSFSEAYHWFCDPCVSQVPISSSFFMGNSIVSSNLKSSGKIHILYTQLRSCLWIWSDGMHRCWCAMWTVLTSSVPFSFGFPWKQRILPPAQNITSCTEDTGSYTRGFYPSFTPQRILRNFLKNRSFWKELFINYLLIKANCFQESQNLNLD